MSNQDILRSEKNNTSIKNRGLIGKNSKSKGPVIYMSCTYYLLEGLLEILLYKYVSISIVKGVN